MSAAAPQPGSETPARPARTRGRGLQLLLRDLMGRPFRADPTRPRRQKLGRAVLERARALYHQLVLPGLEDFVVAAAAALLRVVAPAAPQVVELPKLQRRMPPAPRGWTPTIQTGSATPVPPIARRVLPVLPEQVQSRSDRIRCPHKHAVLSVGSCLGFQEEAATRLAARTATTKRRAPSAYESARPVLTLHECLDCETGRVATGRWTFWGRAHAKLTRKRGSTRRDPHARSPRSEEAGVPSRC